MPILIGIAGEKGSGKDTAADYLVTTRSFVKYALADPIREALKPIFGWADYNFEGVNKEVIDPKWGISPRQAMQHLGTDWGQFGLMDAYPEFGRVVGRKLWAYTFSDWYAYNNMRNVVVSDVRFPHEAEVIRDLGGYLIRVYRSEAVKHRLTTQPTLIERIGNWIRKDDKFDVQKHSSETSIDDIEFDLIVSNDGSTSELFEGMNTAYEHLAGLRSPEVEELPVAD